MNNAIKYGIDYISSRRNYNIKDTIVISGPPRGGTTWLMELLDTLPGYRSIFEPLHFKRVPQLRQLNLRQPFGYPFRPYLSPTDEHPQLKEYLAKVFKGKVVNWLFDFSLHPRVIYKRISANKILVKCIRANRLLPWIDNNFELRAIYLMLRHPCAAISSRIKTWGYPPNVTLAKRITLDSIGRIEYFRDNRELKKKLENLGGAIEVLAAIWAIDTYIPLAYYKRNNPEKWHIVVYEKLVTSFEEEIKAIFSHIGEPIPREVKRMFSKPSRMSYDKQFIGTSKQLLKWKKHLSQDQIKKILEVVGWFGINFYTENPEPDYNALKNWKPPF